MIRERNRNWKLTGMGHFVSPPVGMVGESTVAVPALVRFLAGVRPHVIPQVQLVFEHF